MDDDHYNLLTAITNLVLLYIKRVSDLVNLAAIEAQLALKTLVILAILIFIVGSLLTACWITILTFIFFYLVSLNLSYLISSAIIVGINITVLAIVLFIIYKIKDNLFFPATRHQ